MSDTTSYKITIEGAGLTLEREVSKEIGEQVVVLLLTGKAAVTPTTQAPATVAPQAATSNSGAPVVDPVAVVTPHQAAANPDTSIREFLDSCEAKRVPDKITAIGKYLKRHNEQMDFDKADMIANFENAAEPVPKNIARDIKWTLKAGWIALKNGSKNRYYVTNSGKTAVDQKFSKEVVKKTQGLMPGGSKKTQIKKENEE